MRLLRPLFVSARAIRELEPARRVSARMGALLLLVVGAAAGAAGAEQGGSAGVARDPLFLALIGLAGGLIGGGATFAAAWGAQRQITATLAAQVAELFRQHENATAERAKLGERVAAVEAIVERAS